MGFWYTFYKRSKPQYSLVLMRLGRRYKGIIGHLVIDDKNL